MEMTCGFCTLEVSGHDQNVTRIMQLNVIGGTLDAQLSIKDRWLPFFHLCMCYGPTDLLLLWLLCSDVLARRRGWRALTSMFKNKPVPSMRIKVTLVEEDYWKKTFDTHPSFYPPAPFYLGSAVECYST